MKTELIAYWVRRFLVEHIVVERNLSKNTQKSYRDTFSLLLPFVARRQGTTPDKIKIEHLSTDMVREFFQELQGQRGCSVVTCNQRLATIHSLAQYIAWKSPEHIIWAGQIKAIPFKKTIKTVVPYLEKAEIDTILEAPDAATIQGRRDRAVLLFLYNTGARASEAADLKISDLDLKVSKSVKILGKGSKVRFCPLWKQTIMALEWLVRDRTPQEPLFLNRRKQPLTRFGIHTLVEKYCDMAAAKQPSLNAKQVSPHTIRHTTAVHLLRSGVDINTIRAWLGHVSLDTTNIYAEVDLEMKTKALALCEINTGSKEPEQNRPGWAANHELMTFLRTL
jgi:site-specific recombinase XerD